MKLRHFCLPAALMVPVFANPMHVTRQAVPVSSLHAALAWPEAGHWPLWSITALLCTGMALGWLLFMVSVALMAREPGQTRSRYPLTKERRR